MEKEKEKRNVLQSRSINIENMKLCRVHQTSNWWNDSIIKKATQTYCIRLTNFGNIQNEYDWPMGQPPKPITFGCQGNS